MTLAVACLLALSGCGADPGASPDPANAWNPLLSFEVRRAAWAAGLVRGLTGEPHPRLVTHYVGPADRIMAWLNNGSISPDYRMGYFEFEGHFVYTAFGGRGSSKTYDTPRFFVTVAEDGWQNIVEQGYGPGTAVLPFDASVDWERYWAEKWDGKGQLPSPIEQSPRP